MALNACYSYSIMSREDSLERVGIEIVKSMQHLVVQCGCKASIMIMQDASGVQFLQGWPSLQEFASSLATAVDSGTASLYHEVTYRRILILREGRVRKYRPPVRKCVLRLAAKGSSGQEVARQLPRFDGHFLPKLPILS